MAVENREAGYTALVDEIVHLDHNPLYREMVGDLVADGDHPGLLTELGRVIGRYGQAERLTVNRYFQQPGLRTPEGDLLWARMGEAKELQAREAIRKTGIIFDGLGLKYGYDDLIGEASKVVDELGHAKAFYSLVALFSGGAVKPNSLKLANYPIQVAFGQVRRGLWQEWDFDLGKAVAEGFEGGRGGHLFALTEVTEGPYDTEIVAVATRIYNQELVHMGHGLSSLEVFAPTLTVAQWHHIFESNHRSGSLRVPARGQQFSYPLSVEEARDLVAQVREGRLEPFVPANI